MEKERILKDSVRKLLELNIADKEIVGNLNSVGVTNETAQRILKETKDELSGKALKPALEEEVPKQEAPPEKEDDIYSKVYDELEKDKTPVIQKEVKNPHYTPSLSSTDVNITELWEKGILATVDSKLTEMEKMKIEIDSVIELKINEKIESKAKKIEIVLESQRALFNNKIDTHLEQKSNEIKKVVESKARQLEDLHTKVQAEIIKVQGEKKFNAELLNHLNEKITGLDLVKSQMISETNKALIEEQSEFKEFMAESKQKRDEMEARLNRALQLESKITEGLIDDANQKIQRLQLDKGEELKKQVGKKIAELDEMTKKVDPQGIHERLLALRELENVLIKREKEIDVKIADRFREVMKEFSDFKKEVARIESVNLDELKKEYSSNVDDMFAKSLIGYDKKLKKKIAELDAISEKLDLEKFNATMDSLDLFKKQFVATVSKSVEDYNRSKKELAQSIINRDAKINDYLQRIDSKMQELNAFEQRFAKEVSTLIDKIPEKESKSKNKKP